jgi:hypothetical protein
VDSEAAWKSLQLVTEWVRYADTKATATLAVNGLLLGLIALRVPSTDDLRTNPVKAVLLFAALICAVVSVLLSIVVVLPSDRSRGPADRSLLRFADVAADFGTQAEDFVGEFVRLVDDAPRLRAEIVREVWRGSVVGQRKYRLVSWSIMFLVAAFALTAAAGVATSF